MPIYEEKLISPFAIRFTQEHIRTAFRDGRSIEAAVEEIREQPGTDDYDVILKFPFPAIEIIRWRASPHEDAKISTLSTSLGESHSGDHWFTLDNRRLYCLQRAAAACWPRRAAIAVDILYVTRGSIKRKYATTTYGCSVTIAASAGDSPERTWDWREHVFPGGLASGCRLDSSTRTAIDAILSDDARLTVDSLLNVPGETCSAVARALQSLEAELAIPERSATPSTAEPSDGSDTGSFDTPRRRDSARSCDRRKKRFSPHQSSKVKESTASGEDVSCIRDCDAYTEHANWAAEEIRAQLLAPGSTGYVWVDNWKDIYAPHLGSLKNFLLSRPDLFTVVQGRGRGFKVMSAPPKPHQSGKHRRQKNC